MTTDSEFAYVPLKADARYPGFLAIQRHAVAGYGLQRLRKDDRVTVVAAGRDVPLIELLVGIAGSSLLSLAEWHEVGWFFAEREGEQWSFSLEAGGHFAITHETLVRVCAVIDAMQAGRVSEFGESLTDDEWDRRYGWARESGLLDSRLEALDKLAFRYVSLLKQEGIVPGQPASPDLDVARADVLTALAAEGILNRAQPDAIFYQLRDRNCTYLSEVINAVDMGFHLTEICGDVLPEPGTNEWRLEIFAEHPAIPGSHRVSLDWWILEHEYPWDGTVGTINFAHYCHQVFDRAYVVDLDPLPMEFLGQRLFLLVGRFQNQFELRGVVPERALIEQLIPRVKQRCLERKEVFAPPLTDVAEREAASGFRLPMALRFFLEQVGNGGTIDYLHWLSFDEIIAENDLEAWQRPCPAIIRDSHESFDWEGDELPDGLLCITGYYYNQSRAFLLADGRAVWLTPTESGYTVDPPGFWLCSWLRTNG